MKKRLGIVGLDDVFYNKIRIILRSEAIVERVDESEKNLTEKYDLIFTTASSLKASDPRFITFGDGGDYPLPCLYDDIRMALTAVKRPITYKPLLYLEDKRAYLDGREIALTKKESKLLKILLDAKADGITNLEIHENYPLEFGDYNSLKVYVNYLRKKLEADGDKIIFSSRIPGGCKYYVHDKYWRVH